MNNVGHVNHVEEMDLKVAIVTALPDNPGAPVGGVEAVSVSLVQALAEFDDLDIHVITTQQA